MFCNIKQNRKAFTLAEVLVSAAIFTIFSTAVLSLYSMGSKMFISGSWKYTRQKEAERFFEILKERVEQASSIVSVNIGDKQNPTTREPTTFVVNKKNVELAEGQKATSREYLCQFAVCKPCLKKADGNVLKQGIVVCHGLVLIPDESSGLYNLVLRVERNKDNAEFFDPAGESCVPPSSKDPEYQGNPAEYSLIPLPTSYVLNDVFKVSIEVTSGFNEANTSTSSSTDTSTEGDLSSDKQNIIQKLFSITVFMRNRKHDKTVLEMNLKARVEGAINLSVR